MPHPAWHLKLRTQFMLAFLVVITAMLAVASGLFYTQARAVLIDQLKERLRLTASLAAASIDGDLHQQIHSVDDPLYARVKQKLVRFKDANHEIRALYTMRPVKGKMWAFVVDAEPPQSSFFSPPGEPYDVSGDLENAEGLLHPTASKQLYRDQYGVWLSGYAPIIGKDGVHRAVVGVDMSARKVIEEEQHIQRMAFGIFLFGLILAALVSQFMAQLLNRPIGQLVEGARQASEGDLSVRVPETRRDELGELASSFNHMLKDLARQREELKEQERMSQELATARKIQQAMLPSEPPESRALNIDFFAESASEVGGDYFDFLPLENGKMAIAIGDVTGHGVPAALLMAMIKSCLHTQVRTNHQVAEVMSVANNAVFTSTFDRRLMTFFYSILDTKRGTLTFANAGHLHPYLFRAASREVTTLETHSYPLGVRPNVTYKEQSTELEAGDLLVFYSDGIIEAQNPHGEEFGFDRLEAFIRKNGHLRASELVREFLQQWRSFVFEGNIQATDDDVTVVAVKLVDEALLEEAK